METKDLKEKLRTLECPINWKLEDINKGNAANKLLQRSDTRSEKGDASSVFQEISLFFCLAYLQYDSSDGENKMKEHLEYVEELYGKGGLKYPFINEYSPAVKNVTTAMWAHYYFKEKNTEEAKKYLNLVLPFNKLSVKCKAGIFAIKSCCFMAFGPHDSSEALKAIKIAVELDDEPEWSFLIGKCLARTRRCVKFRSSPSDEELHYLKKAVDQGSRSPSHIVFCALSYQERGLNDQTPAKKKYLDDSYSLFKMAAAYSFDSPTSLARIARGLMRNFHAVSPTGVVHLIENCVRRSYQLCPESGLVNHVAGNFYFKTGKTQMAKYLFHLKKAALESGVYGAYMNLFDMYNTHKTYIDLDLLVNKFWEDFQEIPVDRFKALKTMAAYYFFVKKDNLKAIEFCKEWLQSPQNTDKNQRNSAFVKCENLTVTIADKVRKALQEDNTLTSEEEEKMKEFLDAVEALSH